MTNDATDPPGPEYGNRAELDGVRPGVDQVICVGRRKDAAAPDDGLGQAASSRPGYPVPDHGKERSPAETAPAQVSQGRLLIAIGRCPQGMELEQTTASHPG